MEEKILEGFLKPALSLICPHCEKSHKISVDIKVKITECSKCAKKIKIPENLEETDRLINNLHTLEIVNKELINLKKLVIAQEEEIMTLKEGKNYVGVLPSNYRKVEEITRKLQESLDQVQEDINKYFEQEVVTNEENEDSNSSSNQIEQEQEEN